MPNASKPKLIEWRRENVFTRAEKPTNVKKAHALGYRAKQGFVVVRTRIHKGARIRPKARKGRDPLKTGRRYSPDQSWQTVAEKRVARRFPNMEVLNSYYVGEDGTQTFYEVLLVDPKHPVIKADQKINWICSQRKRAFRGLTASAKRSRK
ncbi:MAG: 50S ribosomal protein L15e [Candidatus Aenigmarchaeota archaeon]|nr:50S ribosomal protein L15e [Candidatus Aenigmarchaeota archaeon]